MLGKIEGGRRRGLQRMRWFDSITDSMDMSLRKLRELMLGKKNTGVGSCSLLQGIFPAQGLNSGLPHCRLILYQLSHQGSPRILEWVAYPFSRGSS